YRSVAEYGVASVLPCASAGAAALVGLSSCRSFLIRIGARRDDTLRLLGARVVGTNDINAPPRQLRGEARVLPFLADRERELPLGHRLQRGVVVLTQLYVQRLHGAEGVGDELRRIGAPLYDIDFLAVQLVDNVVDAAAAHADARADRVDILLTRPDGDLRAA